MMHRQFKCQPFDIYKLSLAIKKHFTVESYDFIKYNGIVNASESSFNARHDKYQFIKLASKYKLDQFRDLLIANYAKNNKKIWVGDINSSPIANEIYIDWLRKKESITYIYEQELKLIRNFVIDNEFMFKELVMKNKNNKLPIIVEFLIQDMISIETFCILDNSINFIRFIDRDYSSDEIWNDISFRVKKYKSFLTVDNEKFKTITTNIMKR